jgi:hypothetical protein
MFFFDNSLVQRLATCPFSKLLLLLLLLLQVLGDEFAQLGCKVFFSFDDSDREAASWAKANKAFAVITDDTDFLCYEGAERIWSANIKLPTGAGVMMMTSHMPFDRSPAPAALETVSAIMC